MKENLTHKLPENFASELIKDDYLNEYLPFFGLIEAKDNKFIAPAVPRGFSQRYPNMTNYDLPFNIVGVEDKIEALDNISLEAARLLNEPVLDRVALLKIAIKAAEICGRSDYINELSEGLDK